MFCRSVRLAGLVALTTLVACAEGIGGAPDAGIGGFPDAPPGSQPDAAPPGTPDASPPGTPDAAPTPMMQTLTQSTSQAIVALNSVACSNQTTGYTADNRYFRTFDLPAFGITSAFSVTSVDIGIEQATGAVGTQPATVTLHTLSGAPLLANLTQIGSTPVTVADQAATVLNIPVTGTAPAGSTLVVEFSMPDGTITGDTLFIGSNTSGESAVGYIASTTCAITEMTTPANLGLSPPVVMHMVMNVTGTYTQ